MQLSIKLLAFAILALLATGASADQSFRMRHLTAYGYSPSPYSYSPSPYSYSPSPYSYSPSPYSYSPSPYRRRLAAAPGIPEPSFWRHIGRAPRLADN